MKRYETFLAISGTTCVDLNSALSIRANVEGHMAYILEYKGFCDRRWIPGLISTNIRDWYSRVSRFDDYARYTRLSGLLIFACIADGWYAPRYTRISAPDIHDYQGLCPDVRVYRVLSRYTRISGYGPWYSWISGADIRVYRVIMPWHCEYQGPFDIHLIFTISASILK